MCANGLIFKPQLMRSVYKTIHLYQLQSESVRTVWTYLTSDCQSVTYLGFSRTEFPEYFCYTTCFNSTSEQLIQLLQS